MTTLTAPIWRAEAPFVPIAITTALFQLFGHGWLGDLSNPLWLGFLFLWLFVVILWSALRVVHHAECLAVKLGEPYGTLILTLSVITIEVMMISTLMLHGDDNPSLARDTMFAVIMIVLNALVGLSLLLGALRYREQAHNLQGASAYLSVIIPLAVLALILPDHTVTTSEPTLSGFQSVFLVVMCLALYGTFLAIQTVRHAGYFTSAGPAHQDDHGHDEPTAHSVPFHAVMLLAYLIPVVLLAEDIAVPIESGIDAFGLPVALGGFVVAALVLTPEAIGAIEAALANRLQRSVNILLGSVLATIGLTVPAVLIVSLVTGKPVELGLQNADTTLLLLTLAVSVVTFGSARTNLLQGMVHLTLFLAYAMLIFAP